MTAPPRVYLDHAATSPVRSEVRAAVLAAMELAGNPSSVHAEGRQARALVERARGVIRQALGGAGAGEITFTSGATEANAMALGGPGVTLASAVEHPSVLARAGIEAVPVDSHGQIDLEALEQRLSQGDIGRLALMLANNETGVVQPMAAAGRLARAASVRLHVDAVQALGKLAIDVDALGCDSLALSAHKIGGPKGIGALWLRDEQMVPPLLVGGGQEGRRRAGTENIVGIAGFAAAVEALTEAELVEIATLRGSLEAGVRAIAPDALIIASEAERVAHISALALAGMPAASQVMALDLAGIAVSAGAACSSGKVARSHVLEAMQLPSELVESTIRVSIGWSNTTADIDHFLEAWGDLARRRRRPAD